MHSAGRESGRGRREGNVKELIKILRKHKGCKEFCENCDPQKRCDVWKLPSKILAWHRREIVKLVESCEEVEPVEKYVLIRKSEILSRAGVKK